MSIFEEMHPSRQINSWWEFSELKRMLAEATERGYVEEVPVMLKSKMHRTENWYRDKQTSVVFSLVTPDPPAGGSWEPVDIEELKRTGHPTQ
jgi:hypothetical protein